MPPPSPRSARVPWAVVLLAWFGACGGATSTPTPGAELPDVLAEREAGPGHETSAVPVDVPTLADHGSTAPPSDIALEDTAAFDAPPDPDGAPPSDDAPTLPEDAPALTDSPPAPPLDGLGPCPHNATDRCPTGSTGCPDLADGVRRVVRFEGFANTLASACEGPLTGLGPDAVLPLTLSGPSDLVVTARPGSGDISTVSLVRMSTCGRPGSELRCGNSITSAGGTATARFPGLPPGAYAVVVSAAAGRPVTVQAQAGLPSPRERGDVCPGAAVSVDGPPLVLRTQAFEPHADYASVCTQATSSIGRVDAIVAYALPSLRDVFVEVSATGSGNLSLHVSSACGEPSAAASQCTRGDPARLVVRRQTPGAYFLTTSYTGAPGRVLTASVRTSAPTPVDASDRCPGSSLALASPASVSVAALGPEAPSPCLPASRADAFYAVTGPAAGLDLLAFATHSARSPVAIELRDRCETPDELRCLGGASTAWRRFTRLSPGARYTLAVATEAQTGSLATHALVVPTTSPVEPRGNTSCEAGQSVPYGGGVFVGDTSAAPGGGLAPCGGLSCAGGRTVWFTLTLPRRKRLLAHTVGSSFDTVLSVFAGEQCPGRLVSGACSHRAVGHASLLDLTLDPGRYHIALSGCGLSARGAYALDLATVPP